MDKKTVSSEAPFFMIMRKRSKCNIVPFLLIAPSSSSTSTSPPPPKHSVAKILLLHPPLEAFFLLILHIKIYSRELFKNV